MPKEISPQELKARLDAGEDILIIDVREDWETALGSLPGAMHLPVDDLPACLDQIPRDKPVVIMCHLGGRSGYVADWLGMLGFGNLLNLSGGIDRWAAEVDAALPRY